MADWPICLQGVYPAYLDWEEFVRNQNQLRDNQSRARPGRAGAARQGQALLPGLVHCGRCGGWMSVAYEGPVGQYPVYRCAEARTESGAPLCQEIRAARVDALVEEALLAALEPDRLAVALAAVEALEDEERELERQWNLRVERARYEAERAERQYQLVEPENRLVARTLEGQWEQALRKVAEVEQQREAWRRERAIPATPADRQALLDLGQNLPQVWHAPTTTAADRKRMLRLVIRAVVLDGKRARGLVWIRITWQTGATTERWVQRRVLGYAEYADLEQLEQRVRELHAAGCVDTAIATALNSAGFQTAHGRPFNGRAVWYLRRRWNLLAVRPDEPSVLAAEKVVTAQEAAGLIGVGVTTIYKWLGNGRLRGVQIHAGLPWRVVLSPERLADLRAYVARARRAGRFKKEAEQ